MDQLTEDVALGFFEELLEQEAERIRVPIDAKELAIACFSTFKEIVEQNAHEVVSYVADARESLPPWSSPNGDVPTMAELRGNCR